MITTTKFKKRLWIKFRNQLVLQAGVLTLVWVFTGSAHAAMPSTAIPFSDIGAKATADYHGDALGITAASDGARLRCGFQKLAGHATPQGLWLESTEPGAPAKLRLVATVLRREDTSTVNSDSLITLPSTGSVAIKDKLVEFTRPGVREEYSVSVDGVRQDFIITERLAGNGDLCLELTLSGAWAEVASHGVNLRLEGTGRQLAYSRLRAQDATGRELKARLEVFSVGCLVIIVTDAGAKYPIRIDPTFSDADWVSLGSGGLPGISVMAADGYEYGLVRAITVDNNGNLYVGGGFTIAGSVLVNNIAKWDGSNWSALGDGTSGGVAALAVSGTNLYAAGGFTLAGGQPAAGIARWDGHSWSALGSGIPRRGSYNGHVNALAVSGTNLYAGGWFTNAGGMATLDIAKWNGSVWSALGSGINGNVNALVVSGTDLYAGGAFTSAGGVSATNIAKWNGTTWSALGSGISGYSVDALAISGSHLYAGGAFSAAGGVSATNIARWNGTTWSPLGSGISGRYHLEVNSLAVVGADLYAGGQFINAGGVSATNIARWDGTTWSALPEGGFYDPVYSPSVNALAVSGTNLYVGGRFTKLGEMWAVNIAKWNSGTWSCLGQGGFGLNGIVTALALSGTNLYAGGAFTIAGDRPASHVARWDGTKWFALGSGLGGGDLGGPVVKALAVSGTDLYVAGNFGTAGGVLVNNIARWNGNTWSALGSGITGRWSNLGGPLINALAVIGGDLYVAGDFTAAGEVAANNIARWNGSTWSPLGSGLGDSVAGVAALAVCGTNLYAGGGFTFGADYVAKWNESGWWSLGADGPVLALAANGTDLYAAGNYGDSGGPAWVSQWNGRSWSRLGGFFGPYNPYDPTLTAPYVYALAISGPDLYVGGNFLEADGMTAYFLAVWDGIGWSPVGSGMNAPVRALAAEGVGNLFVGGYFALAGTIVSPYVAQANLGSPPIFLTPLQSQTAESGSWVAFIPDIEGYLPMTYLLLSDETNLICCNTDGRLTLTNVDFTTSGSYTIVVTNAYGAVTSTPAMLNVIPPVERRPVPAINLMGDAGSSLNVEHTDALGPLADWLPLDTVNLTNPPQFCFDVTIPLPPQRFYRAWQLGSPAMLPSLSPPFMVPAIMLKGNVGDLLRLDYINAIGPTDAWVTLGTVTLTNTSQLYFDTTSIGQLRRLYRIAPVP